MELNGLLVDMGQDTPTKSSRTNDDFFDMTLADMLSRSQFSQNTQADGLMDLRKELEADGMHGDAIRGILWRNLLEMHDEEAKTWLQGLAITPDIKDRLLSVAMLRADTKGDDAGTVERKSGDAAGGESDCGYSKEWQKTIADIIKEMNTEEVKHLKDRLLLPVLGKLKERVSSALDKVVWQNMETSGSAEDVPKAIKDRLTDHLRGREHATFWKALVADVESRLETDILAGPETVSLQDCWTVTTKDGLAASLCEVQPGGYAAQGKAGEQSYVGTLGFMELLPATAT